MAQDNLGKPSPERLNKLDINEATFDGRQWHLLDHMQIICILPQTDNHASISSLIFYRLDALPNA